MKAQEKYRLAHNVFGSWIIVHPEHAYLAWSGSCWVAHQRGVGAVAQVSNFNTQEAADSAARQQIP